MLFSTLLLTVYSCDHNKDVAIDFFNLNRCILIELAKKICKQKELDGIRRTKYANYDKSYEYEFFCSSDSTNLNNKPCIIDIPNKYENDIDFWRMGYKNIYNDNHVRLDSFIIENNIDTTLLSEVINVTIEKNIKSIVKDYYGKETLEIDIGSGVQILYVPKGTQLEMENIKGAKFEKIENDWYYYYNPQRTTPWDFE